MATAPVNVAAGQIATVRLVMVSGAAISGKVTDAGGKPVRDIPLQAFRVLYSGGAVVPQMTASLSTDDRGDYRIFGLPPGEYYIAVVPRQMGGPVSPLSGTIREIPIRTFYPGTTDLNGSIPISLNGGDERYGIDIQVRTTVPVTISGSVASFLPPVVRSTTTTIGAAETVRPSIADWYLVSREGNRDDLTFSGKAAPDNTFQISNVPAGIYELIARLPASKGWGPNNPPGLSLASWAFGRSTVGVRDSNVENVRVVVHPGVDLNGVITVDGKRAAAAVRLSLRPDDPASKSSALYDVIEQIAVFQPAIGQDGSFLFPLLPEARYRIEVVLGAALLQLNQTIRVGQENTSVRTPPTGLMNLPDTAYVADIRQAGVSVFDNGLKIGTVTPASLDVAVNTDGGRLEGTVLDAEQKPVVNAVVVLVPPVARRQNAALYKTVRSDTQGRFAFTPVPPGTHRLFAWEAVPAGAYQNSTFLSRFEAQGTSVTVAPYSRVNVNVALIRVSQ
jgi:hypothetical protein